MVLNSGWMWTIRKSPEVTVSVDAKEVAEALKNILKV